MFRWCKPKKQTQPETAQAANQVLSQAAMESAAAIIPCDTCGREIYTEMEMWTQDIESGLNICFDCKRIDRERKDHAFKEAFDEAMEKQNRPSEMPIGCELPLKTAYTPEDNDFCEEEEPTEDEYTRIYQEAEELKLVAGWVLEVYKNQVLPLETKLNYIGKLLNMGVA